MTVSQLFTAAKALSFEDREALCVQLAETLDTRPIMDENAWMEVAKRRAEELRSGKIKGIPAEEVFAKIRRMLRAQGRSSTPKPAKNSKGR